MALLSQSFNDRFVKQHVRSEMIYLITVHCYDIHRLTSELVDVNQENVVQSADDEQQINSNQRSKICKIIIINYFLLANHIDLSTNHIKT